MLSLAQLQAEQRPWVEHNFPGREPYYPLLGAIEELGELCHAHLKQLQGIRGTSEEHQTAKADAVGDAIIFLADYCTANGIDLQQAVEETWGKVKQRDWQKDKLDGGGRNVRHGPCDTCEYWHRVADDDVRHNCGRCHNTTETPTGIATWVNGGNTSTDCLRYKKKENS
jgi:NTP pyrophosphatase (non-canonical NTP hydrolase)